MGGGSVAQPQLGAQVDGIRPKRLCKFSVSSLGNHSINMFDILVQKDSMEQKSIKSTISLGGINDTD